MNEYEQYKQEWFVLIRTQYLSSGPWWIASIKKFFWLDKRVAKSHAAHKSEGTEGLFLKKASEKNFLFPPKIHPLIFHKIQFVGMIADIIELGQMFRYFSY